MIVTGNRLSRRTVLKGIGAAIGLPFLDAMTPAFAASRSRRPVRARLVLRAQRHRHAELDAGGRRAARRRCPAILAPLEPLKDDLLVLSNLTAQLGPSAAGRRGRSRPRRSAAYMTGVEVYKTAGADLKLGVSADQIAADAVGQQTQLPSLEIGLEEARQAGNCDSGYSCAYTYNLSWKTETQPLPPISDPRSLFERLFGTDVAEPPAAHAAGSRCARASSTRCSATRNRLKSTLGGVDRRKLDEYLTSVREIEQQVERAAKEGTVIDPGIEKPFGVPAEFPDYFRLMTDMMIVAFKADHDAHLHDDDRPRRLDARLSGDRHRRRPSSAHASPGQPWRCSRRCARSTSCTRDSSPSSCRR